MNKIITLLAVFALTGAVSCGGSSDEESGADGNSNVGVAISSLFGSSDQQGLKVQADDDDEGPGDPCDLDCPDGIDCVTAVAAGTYGPSSDSQVVDSAYSCDSSDDETSCMTWTMTEEVTIECADGNVVFDAGGTGIVCNDFSSEDSTGNIFGDFVVAGETISCHVTITGLGGAEQMTASCEDGDGNAIEQDTAQQCTVPQ